MPPSRMVKSDKFVSFVTSMPLAPSPEPSNVNYRFHFFQIHHHSLEKLHLEEIHKNFAQAGKQGKFYNRGDISGMWCYYQKDLYLSCLLMHYQDSHYL